MKKRSKTMTKIGNLKIYAQYFNGNVGQVTNDQRYNSSDTKKNFRLKTLKVETPKQQTPEETTPKSKMANISYFQARHKRPMRTNLKTCRADTLGNSDSTMPLHTPVREDLLMINSKGNTARLRTQVDQLGISRPFHKMKYFQRVTDKKSVPVSLPVQKVPKVNPFSLKVIKKLGKGQIGDIYLAYSVPNRAVVVIKQFQKRKAHLEFMIDQFKIQLYCSHPHILPAYGYYMGKNDAYLIMEAGTSNLYDEIKNFGPFSESKTANYLIQLLKAVEYLHINGVIHRDIKPENTIITFDGTLKICDFGWSAITGGIRRTFCGTLDYVPPEVAKKEVYNSKIDCWCIGVLAYQMLTISSPYDCQKLLKNPHTEYNKLKFPEKLSKDSRNFIQGLLTIDPKKRMTAHQALKHPWLVRMEQENSEKIMSIEEDIIKVVA